LQQSVVLGMVSAYGTGAALDTSFGSSAHDEPGTLEAKILPKHDDPSNQRFVLFVCYIGPNGVTLLPTKTNFHKMFLNFWPIFSQRRRIVDWRYKVTVESLYEPMCVNQPQTLVTIPSLGFVRKMECST